MECFKFHNVGLMKLGASLFFIDCYQSHIQRELTNIYGEVVIVQVGGAPLFFIDCYQSQIQREPTNMYGEVVFI